MNKIFVNKVSKILRHRQVLKDVSFSVASGQSHALVGSSGSGKSTLLRMLMGLMDPDSGTIETLPRKAIGYVPQDEGLFPHLTAAHNIMLVARSLRWPRHQVEGRLRELIDLFALESNLLRRYPRELSGGQRQRVALMRALFLDPQFLILDEPLGALDPLIRSDLQGELRRIFRKLSKGVIFVTHDIGEAMFFCHTVTLLHEGVVMQTGSPKDFLTQPASDFVKKFIHAQRSVWDVGAYS